MIKNINNEVASKIGGYLNTASSLLVNWLNERLPRLSYAWWEDNVLDKLSYNQRQTADENHYTKLEQFDLAALLRIATQSWYDILRFERLPNDQRRVLKRMQSVRNNAAHRSAGVFDKDLIVDDLQTLSCFFDYFSIDESEKQDVLQFLEIVKDTSSSIFDSQPIAVLETTKPEVFENKNDSIKTGDMVFLTSDPRKIGLVMSVIDCGSSVQYKVFIDNTPRDFFEGQIQKVQQTAEIKWIDINTFRSHLAAYQINHPSSSNLYSLNSSRIDFVPYQFKPALKIIHSDEPRILVADSVGVGKTIEAGLIIKELQARKDVEKVLIICPKPLVAERKWELEMKRFDEDFVPLDGPALRQALSDTDRDGVWPVRYNKVIIPYSILDSKTYTGETVRRHKTYGLLDMDPAIHFDLVIIDEAHHIRNGHEGYDCVKYFCDNADAVVMLTATPIQTSDNDLFTLLNVLRPDIFIDEATFSSMSRPNEFITRAARIVRHHKENWQNEAIDELKKISQTSWGENVTVKDPSYSQALEVLSHPEISQKERIKLNATIEGMHSLDSIINRTRRRDIQDFCKRKPQTLEVSFTDYQFELYKQVLEFEQKALLKIHGNAQLINFMTTTIRRQASSCIFGLAPYLQSLIERRFDDLNIDAGIDEDISFSDQMLQDLFEQARVIFDLTQNMPEEDPKFDAMLEKILEKQNQDNNKIILFSSFRNTLNYLENKLSQHNLRVAQINGSIKDEARRDLRKRFMEPKTEEDSIDILLFTEVGSEGLDYQFCNMMINYDLPWNPMRVEQRIGRIDRRGQKSEVVTILNVITEGTVDATIYDRCLSRIKIFENSIGECEEILGSIAKQIEKIMINPNLSEEERQEKIQIMSDNEVKRIEAMERLEEDEKEFMGLDLSEHFMAQEIQKAESSWMTPENIQSMIMEYFKKRLKEGYSIEGAFDQKNLRLSADARALLKEDFDKTPGARNAARVAWNLYLKGKDPNHPITFDAATAQENNKTFFITPMHPLTKQAALYLKNNDETFVHLQVASSDVPKGEYKFSIYAWNYVGLKSSFKLKGICENVDLERELPDILNNHVHDLPRIEINPDDWKSLAVRHRNLWQEKRNAEIARAEERARFKMQSLKASFNAQRLQLEHLISVNTDENIIRMYRSKLEHAKQDTERKINEIEKQVKQTDIHTTLITNGILKIV